MSDLEKLQELHKQLREIDETVKTVLGLQLKLGEAVVNVVIGMVEKTFREGLQNQTPVEAPQPAPVVVVKPVLDLDLETGRPVQLLPLVEVAKTEPQPVQEKPAALVEEPASTASILTDPPAPIKALVSTEQLNKLIRKNAKLKLLMKIEQDPRFKTSHSITWYETSGSLRVDIKVHEAVDGQRGREICHFLASAMPEDIMHWMINAQVLKDQKDLTPVGILARLPIPMFPADSVIIKPATGRHRVFRNDRLMLHPEVPTILPVVEKEPPELDFP